MNNLNLNTNTILQIVALLFLVILGYMAFRSESKWGVIKEEIKDAVHEVKASQDTLALAKAKIAQYQKDFELMKLQKDVLIHKRDSIILGFKKKTTRDARQLKVIKDSIEVTNKLLQEEEDLLQKLFGKK